MKQFPSRFRAITCTVITCVAFLALNGCKTDLDDVWDSIDSLDSRLTAIEKAVDETNSNLAALKQLFEAVEENYSIASVTPFTEGGGGKFQRI